MYMYIYVPGTIGQERMSCDTGTVPYRNPVRCDTGNDDTAIDRPYHTPYRKIIECKSGSRGMAWHRMVNSSESSDAVPTQ